MSGHINRGRLTVNPDGNWRHYTNTIPARSTALGTVTRDEGDTGALVRIEATGAYVQVNAGAILSLDGRKVAAALGLTHRPVSPSPTDIRSARADAGLTQTQAAQLVHSTLRTWQDWEAGKAQMHPGLWELFRLKAAG